MRPQKINKGKLFTMALCLSAMPSFTVQRVPRKPYKICKHYCSIECLLRKALRNHSSSSFFWNWLTSVLSLYASIPLLNCCSICFWVFLCVFFHQVIHLALLVLLYLRPFLSVTQLQISIILQTLLRFSICSLYVCFLIKPVSVRDLILAAFGLLFAVSFLSCTFIALLLIHTFVF